MPSLPFVAETVTNAVPATFWAGNVTSGTATLTLSQNTGRVRLVMGIDIFCENQPANGSITLLYQDHAHVPSSFAVIQVQQSQNFPGPFYWRGLFPVYDTAALLQWEASVPFSYVIWGCHVPNWEIDLGIANV